MTMIYLCKYQFVNTLGSGISYAVYALNADAELREKIRQRDKAVRDYANDMAVAKDKGRVEKAMETAVNLIRMGVLTPEQIAQATGLPLETIQELSKEHSTT